MGLGDEEAVEGVSATASATVPRVVIFPSALLIAISHAVTALTYT